MTIDRAVERLNEMYMLAKEVKWIMDPVAYALFQVWKEADRDRKDGKQ